MLKTYKCMVNLYVLFTQRAKETRDEGDDEVQAEVNFLWLLFYKRATSLLVLLRYPVTPSINTCKAFLLLLL